MKTGKTHTVRLDLRVHPDLKRQLAEFAALQRMTPSEAVRAAIRAYLKWDVGTNVRFSARAGRYNGERNAS